MEVRDRVILVTGAAGGMGRALCRRLGHEGARLGIVDRDEAALKQVQLELERAGVECAAAPADVRSRDQVRAAIDTVTTALAPVDIFVAAAGICDISTVDDLHVPFLEEMLQVNFLGVVFAIEAVLPGMLERRQGQIVALVSLSAVCPLPFENGYSASKAALAAYLQALRPPLRRRGVQVTSVFPASSERRFCSACSMNRARGLRPGRWGPRRPPTRSSGRFGKAAASRSFRRACAGRLGSRGGSRLAPTTGS